jgi:hypothetical protein
LQGSALSVAAKHRADVLQVIQNMSGTLAVPDFFCEHQLQTHLQAQFRQWLGAGGTSKTDKATATIPRRRTISRAAPTPVRQNLKDT